MIIKAHNRELRSLDRLTAISTPDIQRTLSRPAVDAIIAFQKEYYAEHGRFLIIGVISIAKTPTHDYLLDGQHRVTAFIELAADYIFPDIAVEVFEVDEQYIDCLYKLINTSTPNAVASIGIDVYRVINDLEKWLMTTHGNFVKQTDASRTPCISWPRTKEIITSRKITIPSLVKAAEILNTYYAGLPATKFIEWGVVGVHETLRKINDRPGNKLYFSLFHAYEWVDRLIDVAMGHSPQELQHVVIKRTTIRKPLRKKVWGLSALDGRCYCCEGAISFDNFECGHIVSVAHGGATNENNLRPICRGCNSDMRTMHMEEYKRLLAA